MIKQQLQLKLSQKLSPQQIQLMKLIQLSTQELEQKIQSEIGENPALENGKEIANQENEEDSYEDSQSIDTQDIDIDSYLSDDDIPAYRTQISNYSADQEEKSIPVSGGITFHQILSSQLQNLILDEQESEIASFLVGSIDESGYIRRSIDEIMDDLAFTQNIFVEKATIEKILKRVQQLDPPGVGARSLQECLQLQLERKQPNRINKLALEIVSHSFDEFSKKHYQKLMDRFDIEEDVLKEVFRTVSKLNPKPGGALANTSQNTHIVPDFILTLENGEIQVELNRRNTPELRVSQTYKEMFAGYKDAPEKNKSQEEAVLFIKQKLDAAKWFIEAIEQRYNTLLMTINAIVELQSEYFLSGDEKMLKPMILKDIADRINMDISTISRVANSKYIDTPYGTKLLKSFFSEGMKNEEGEDVSTIEIKKILEQLIEKEDKKKPLTDSALSQSLKEKGYPVARRTVAKYREQLEFPVARLRKQI